jgi:hypothetical protein
MALIGFFLIFACVTSADVPAPRPLHAAIRAADFDRIAANMRQRPDLSWHLPAARLSTRGFNDQVEGEILGR